MTVRELIKELKRQPQDLIVVRPFNDNDWKSDDFGNVTNVVEVEGVSVQRYPELQFDCSKDANVELFIY